MLVPLAVAVSLSACAETGGGASLFSPRADYTDLAYAALARGDYSTAARRAGQALEQDANNPRALFAQAVAAEYTNSPDQARVLYQRLTAMPEAEQAMMGGGWSGPRKEGRSIADVAAVRLKSVGMLPATSLMPLPLPTETPARTSAAAPATAAPLTMPAAPRTAAPASPPDFAERPEPPLSGIALLNAADRFRVLKRLLDADLISEDEYTRRRAANIGAVLPYSTKTRPAEGLGKPVPSAEQVMMRLEALRRTLAAGALRPEEHAAERRAIIDAILPAEPADAAPPAAPPISMADAAERADALQRLRDLGIISANEYGRERKALEAQTRGLARQGASASSRETLIDSKTPDRRTTAPAAPKPAVAPETKPDRVLVPKTDAEALAARRGTADARGRMVGQQPTMAASPNDTQASGASSPRGVVLHLASYRTEEQAREGWSALSQRYPEALSGLKAQLGRVDLGPGKGAYWRLNAGPVDSAQRANVLCGQLSAQGQYCKAAFPEG